MNTRPILLAVGLLIGMAAAPAFAQSNATIQGTESAAANGAGGPSAATTTGNLSTTTTTSSGATFQTPGGGPLTAGSVNTSGNTVAQTPGSPANTGK